MKKINYIEGQLIGGNGIVFIKEIDTIKRKTSNNYISKRVAIFKCHCGNEFKTTIEHVKSNHTSSCGCTRKTEFTNKKHGKRQHRLYPIWSAILTRCLNKNDKNFKNYGGRGIKIFPIWEVDFLSFHDYVTALPDYNKADYTLDRINNDGGYFPGNLRWTTRRIQTANSRNRKGTKSGYRGVYFQRKKWVARIEGIHLGSFNSIEEAIIARNSYIIDRNLSIYALQQIE